MKNIKPSKEMFIWLGLLAEEASEQNKESPSSKEKIGTRRIGIGGKRVEFFLKIWEKRKELPSSMREVAYITGFTDNKEKGVPGTVNGGMLILTRGGFLEKEGPRSQYMFVDKKIKNKDLEKYMWLGKAFYNLWRIGIEEDKLFWRIGTEKVHFINWLWENRDNLELGARGIAHQAGFSPDKSTMNATVLYSLKALTMANLVSRRQVSYEETERTENRGLQPYEYTVLVDAKNQ